MRRSRNSGEFTGRRLISVELVVVVGVWVTLAMAAALAGLVLGIAGNGVGSGVLIPLSVLVLGGLVWRALITGYRADRRLSACPAPTPDETVLVAVRPVGRGVAASTGAVALALLCSALVLVVSGSAWRLDDSPRGRPDTERATETYTVTPEQADAIHRRLESGMPIDDVLRGMEPARPVAAPASASDTEAAVGTGLVLLGLLLGLGALAGFSAGWLVANRGRDQLWLSEAGLGYLPGRADDDGYLPWPEVTALEYVCVRFRGVVSQHRWTVRSTTRPPTTVSMPAGIEPRSDIVFLALGELAPHVMTSAPDSPSGPMPSR